MDFDAALNWKENRETVPAVADPMDPATHMHHFDKFGGKISEMSATAMSHDVTDDKSNAEAVEMAAQAKQLAKAIEDRRVELKAPYLAVTGVLDRETKKLKDGLSEIGRILSAKITPYMQAKERERAEAQREAEEEARKERERIEAERQKAGAEDVAPIVPEVVSRVPEQVKTETSAGSAQLKTKTAWEVLDFRALPDEVFEERWDHIVKALAPWINAQIKAGIKNISGVRVYEESVLETRAKR